MKTPSVRPGDCLDPTRIVDSDHPAVVAYANEHAIGDDDRECAVSLYYAVRDGIRYDGYGIELTERGLSASRALEIGRGWCVSKAALLAACCRAVGIPAALGYADVRNHLSTERMRQTMKTDVFYWHGYTAIWLDETWVKSTPAFNRELCEKFRIRTLEFDGSEDSIYHPYDLDGRQHMEYLAYRGEFADVPLSRIQADFRQHYPHLSEGLGEGDFDREVDAETAAR
ncbi:MAG: transglutaminase domain-containing protein [Gammaproteobacteria bacterium]